MPRRVLCATVVLFLGLAACGAAEPANGGKATVKKSEYGKTAGGDAVDLYTLTNANGVVCKVITYGGIVTERNTALDTGNKLIGWGFTGSSNAQNRTIQEGTFGWIHTLWRDPKYGALQYITQYAYFTRDPFFVAANTPKNAHQNAIWFDLRYVLPGSAPTIEPYK